MTEGAGGTNASTPAGETSVSGLSDEFYEAVRAFAKDRNETMRMVFDDAVQAMINRIRAGEDVVFPAVRSGRGSNARHIRMTKTVLAGMIATCKKVKVHKSVFFHLALRDYLVSNGVDAPE